MPPGALVISFDFELAWGMRTSSRRRTQPLGTQRVGEVVHALLDILARHEISATWATVGHLMLRPEDCPSGRYVYDLPAPQPAWFDGPWYEGIPPLGTEDAPWYYAPELVDTIVGCPVHQELACHTFSHARLGDRDCSGEVALAELDRCRQLALNWGRELESLVFPQNLVGHLSVVRDAGYKCYRASNSEWYWFGRPAALYARRWLRYGVWLLRWLDEWSCFCPPLPPARRCQGLWEIPHSMFFPGFNGVSRYITPDRRWRRARRGLQRAAQRGRIFGLFTHPRNFLPNPAPLLEAFERICQTAAELRAAGRLHILTMGQAAAELEAGRQEQWLGHRRPEPCMLP